MVLLTTAMQVFDIMEFKYKEWYEYVVMLHNKLDAYCTELKAENKLNAQIIRRQARRIDELQEEIQFLTIQANIAAEYFQQIEDGFPQVVRELGLIPSPELIDLANVQRRINFDNEIDL